MVSCVEIRSVNPLLPTAILIQYTTMAEFTALKKVILGPHHSQPTSVGATIHEGRTMRPRAPFIELQIARYEGEKSCYLFHISGNDESTDTLHDSLEDAMQDAEDIYGVARMEWIDVNAPFRI